MNIYQENEDVICPYCDSNSSIELDINEYECTECKREFSPFE